MAKIAKPSIDFSVVKSRIASQFTGLDLNNPAAWPALPKYALCLMIAAAVTVALWFTWLSTSAEELSVTQAKELVLKDDYKKKGSEKKGLRGWVDSKCIQRMPKRERKCTENHVGYRTLPR